MIVFQHSVNKGLLGLSILNGFILLGLLKLTNFNYYLSQWAGFETEINHTGGNAFNFINYIGTGFLVYILVAKSPSITTKWASLWPFALLVVIYAVNFLFAPYVNSSWFLYQLVFLAIATLLHITCRKVSFDFTEKFRWFMNVVFWVFLAFVVFCLYQILSRVSPSYYISEFNDAFVQSLNEFGVMKQRYGYLLGFLLSYVLFIINKRPLQIALLAILAIAGFGIRSFVIGAAISLLLFSIRRPRYLALTLGFLLVAFISIIAPYFENLVYDTRFYSYVNALDIVQRFPFGVGLGGYPVYTEEFNRNLLADLYNVNALLDYIPAAPESDFVHVLGSLGLICGVIHLVIQFRLVWYSQLLEKNLVPFERCILFYFCFMTFFGISEDSMFSINYWIFFGIASGIVSSLLLRFRKDTV